MIHAFPKFALTFVTTCWLFVGLAHATPTTSGFEAGNKLYAAGNFAGAIESYEKQAGRGEYTANLFYNLADAYYRQGDRGRAILNYQRALILDPAHAEAAANLAFVRGVKLTAPAPHAGWIATTLPWIAASAGWLGLAGIVVAASGSRRAAGVSMAVLGLLACTAGIAAIWFFAPTDETSRAVVVADSAPVFYAPANNSKVVTTLVAGGELRVLSDQGAWIYALLTDGTRAWIASDKIERIVPR